MPPTTATTAPATDTDAVLDGLDVARERTLALVEPVCAEDLERVHSKLMSPLVWDLGHIAAFEDLWLVHRFGGEPMLRGDLAQVYDAFETPRWERGDLPYLRCADAHAYLAEVRARVRELTEARGVGDGLLHELVIRHEHQHQETMLQTLMLAQLPDYDPRWRVEPPAAAPGSAPTGLELLDVPAGPFELGAPDDGFAYDNERPRQTVSVDAFRIGRTPITNATFLHFVEGGGYQRREWWADEAWHWKEEYDITHPLHWTGDGREWRVGGHVPLDPSKPVVNVSWFEADAFARAHGARLPTEVEWEKAATWDQDSGASLAYPWGAEAPTTDRANLDQFAFGTHPATAHPAGASPIGCLGMLGDAWEWTSSGFDGYPGFRAHPYREYSEVFFGGDWRVLRGGSWATCARVATPTFRNWDHPQRRQIFAESDRERRVNPLAELTDGHPAIRIDVHVGDGDGAERRLADDVLDGLTRPFKEIPPKHFYDSRGSALFERICEQPEYYPTRTEMAILEASAAEIVDTAASVELVELGSGATAKARLLLDAMDGGARRYVPVDVSERMVREAAVALVDDYEGIEIHGVVGDFERHLDRVPRPVAGEPRLVALLGGTIGNFPPGTRRSLLRDVAALLDSDDHFLLGTDLVKDPAIIEAAYDDMLGVTAEFNRNVLHVMNRELGADFEPDAFDHVAFFDRRREWVEMRLRAQRPMTVRVAELDLQVEFAAGEELRTEISAKFTRRRIERDYAAAGLELRGWYTDPEELFAVTLAGPAR